MAFQAVPDTAQVRFKVLGKSATFVEGLTWYFSLYVRDTITGWTQVNVDALWAYASGWWDAGKDGSTGLKTQMNASWIINELRVQDLGDENGLFKAAVPASPDGTGAGDPMSPNTCALVRLFGDTGAAPKRGRIFWSGFSETAFNGDNVVPSNGTALALRFTAFRNDLNDLGAGGQADWAQVLVSRYQGTEADPTPKLIATKRLEAVTNTLGSAASVRDVVAVQKNRREGE